MLLRSLASTALLIIITLGTAPAAAQWEVEFDPLAYMVDGYSAHVARSADSSTMRLQLGVFGADVPEWLHGEDDFDLRVRGVTVKLDYFLSDDLRGFFVGIDADYSNLRYSLQETGAATRQRVVGLGPRVGYRFEVGRRVYITPWVSVRYLFGAEDVLLEDKRFEQDRYAVFPTVHIGWRF